MTTENYTVPGVFYNENTHLPNVNIDTELVKSAVKMIFLNNGHEYCGTSIQDGTSLEWALSKIFSFKIRVEDYKENLGVSFTLKFNDVILDAKVVLGTIS